MAQLKLKFGNREETQFVQEELTLVPTDSLDSYASLATRIEWELPWEPWARLTFTPTQSGPLVTNETGDTAVQLNGHHLTHAPLHEGDQLTIGPLTITLSPYGITPDQERLLERLDLSCHLRETPKRSLRRLANLT